MSDPIDETNEIKVKDSEVEEYIKNLGWSPATPDEVKTYVVGNIRGFYSWLCDKSETIMNKPDILVCDSCFKKGGASECNKCNKGDKFSNIYGVV